MSVDAFFDGIGTQIISIVISLLFGGAVGYFIRYRIEQKNKSKQSQKARDNANQSQIGSINIVNNKERNDGRWETNAKSKRPCSTGRR